MELKDTIHNFVEAAVISLGNKSLSDFLTAFQSTNDIENEFGETDEQYRD